MLDDLRKPFFYIALALLGVLVLVELGSTAYLGSTVQSKAALNLPTPGLGIPYLALLDGLLLFTATLIALSLIVPERVQGRVQGIATLIVSLLVLLASIAMIFVAIGLLMLMVSLFLAIPFGTLVYLGMFGDFSLGAARATLAFLMTLKLAFGIFLLLAHQRFLENKGLVLIIFTSLLANVVVSFLQGLVPTLLVSITDAVAAIVVGILAAIWALIFLIGSIPSVIKALRVDRALS